MTARVVIVQRVLTHYRIPFYERLRPLLRDEGVELALVHGQEHPSERSRRDKARLDWAVTVENRYWAVGRRRVCWQPVLNEVRSGDLIVVEQASRMLLNYLLMARRLVGGPKLAFWGHGRNLDHDSASPLSEAVKRRLVRHADWWFCYTEGVACHIEPLGVPRDRLTVVQNAIDTTSLRRWQAALRPTDTVALRHELGIGDGPTAVALGSIYPRKRPQFLLDAGDCLAATIPGFHLIVIGDGPDRPLLDASASTRPWLRVVGARLGEDLVRYASLGTVILNPGLVGLSVLDSFALGLPMVTCEFSHAPEVEYLQHGVNGLLLPAATTPAEYAHAVRSLLLDPSQVHPLVQGCREAAGRYTIEEMAERFAGGVLQALARPL